MRFLQRTAGVSVALLAGVAALTSPRVAAKTATVNMERLPSENRAVRRVPSSSGIESQWRDTPFRAVQVIVRRGPNGAVMTRGRVARSSDGSMFVELVDAESKEPVEALIFDVPHQREVVLDIAKRRYRMRAMPGLKAREAPADSGAELLRTFTEQRAESAVREVKDGVELTSRRLGVKRIAGLEAVGSVESRRPLAGAGEIPDGPVETRESWLSVDLGIAVLQTRHDPVTGEDTEVSLTEVIRAEPEPTLFTVPAGYVLDTGEAKLVRPPAR